MDDPLARTLPTSEGERNGRIEPATASWPSPKPQRRPGSKAGRPGTRAFKKGR